MFVLSKLTPALKSKQWGQGNCKYDNQFDCQQDPYGLSDNTCIDKTQLCNGHRDCSWMDTSQASWDEDPEWCKCFKGDSLSEDEQDNDGNDDDDEDEEQDEDDEEDEQEEDDGDDDEDENDQTKAKGNWGQGDCKYDNQFDCRQDPYGPSDNTCIDKSQRCDGKRDCLWKDTSRDSWDEDPAWCATLHDSGMLIVTWGFHIR